jgi:A/G-specific adenine glycosylase
MHDQLIAWYQQNKRDLPWRNTKDPYFIWLSEIILQQTRVDQGLPYFLKFTTHYPTIFDLAIADEQAVLKDWQGLGYYSRARNLHNTAKTIVSEFNGLFPKTYEEILTLKGVGSYTAAAISSFAFDLPHAVLDGNVFRVLSRLFDIETPINTVKAKKEFTELAYDLLPKNQAATYNQAIMEFGALICIPINPKCNDCVLNQKCLSFYNKTVQKRPQKEKKNKIRNRYFNYYFFEDDTYYTLQKREENDIWKNMYEFPKTESISFENFPEILQDLTKQKLEIINVISLSKHVLSHQHIYSKFYIIKGNHSSLNKKFNSIIRIKKCELIKYPIPKLIDNFLEKYQNF